ncbi:hypothetical protein TWF696_008424 [Orbilia brochopaga]|uniref:Uncharacterized protein n=1 Tax=Orbilia brochopaga TaxID=3140254 RepID=A0AAV9UGP4_9PEZI
MASIHESIYTDDTRSISPRSVRHRQPYPDRGSSILAYLESVGLQRSLNDATVVNSHQSFLSMSEVREYYPEVDKLQFELERKDFEEYMLSDTTEVYSLTRYADGEYLCYSLPVRVQVDTRRLRKKLNKSDTGLHQLNLPNFHIDIRSSRVVLCYQYHHYNKSATLVAVDFQDGRWSRLVEIPREAMANALDQLDVDDNDPFIVNLVYLGIIIAWWRNALSSFGEQLVEHEKYLLEALRSPDFGTEDTAKLHDQVNISLHNMALHLHRYQSETKCIVETLAWLDQKHKAIQQFAGAPSASVAKVSQSLDNLKNQAESLEFTVAEMTGSVNNILGLLFNNTSAFTQKMQVSNGVQMQAILLATREDTQASRWVAQESIRLAEEMKMDSLSMKTIAIVTMLFLPGASFAVLLAMPFFAQDGMNTFFRKENLIYIWVALTIPTTIACFIFYCWKQRKNYLKQQRRVDDEKAISRSVSGSSKSGIS